MEDLILSSIDSEVRVVALEIIKTQFPNRWQQMDFNHKNGLPRKGSTSQQEGSILVKNNSIVIFDWNWSVFYKKNCAQSYFEIFGKRWPRWWWSGQPARPLLDKRVWIRLKSTNFLQICCWKERTIINKRGQDWPI